MASGTINSGRLYTKTFSSSAFDISAGANGSCFIPITEPSYALAIVGVLGHGSGGLAYSDWAIADNSAKFWFRNTTTSNKTGVVLDAIVLYQS